MSVRLESALIEITDECNLASCVHCSSSSKPEGTGTCISLNTLKKVLRILFDLGVKELELSGGEPLLYPKHVRLVLEMCREYNARLRLFTNGVLLYGVAKEGLFREYWEYLEVHVPLHGPPELHNRIVGRPNHFGLLYESLLKLAEYCGRHGVKPRLIGFHFVLTRLNAALSIIEDTMQVACSLLDIFCKISNLQVDGMFSILRLQPQGRAVENWSWLAPTFEQFVNFYRWLKTLKDGKPRITLRLGCPIAPRLIPVEQFDSNVKVSRECRCAITHIYVGVRENMPLLLPCVAFKQRYYMWWPWCNLTHIVDYPPALLAEEIVDRITNMQTARQRTEEEIRTSRQRDFYCLAAVLYHGIDVAPLAEEIAVRE